jgi:hypothetical protein
MFSWIAPVSLRARRWPTPPESSWPCSTRLACADVELRPRGPFEERAVAARAEDLIAPSRAQRIEGGAGLAQRSVAEAALLHAPVAQRMEAEQVGVEDVLAGARRDRGVRESGGEARGEPAQPAGDGDEPAHAAKAVGEVERVQRNGDAERVADHVEALLAGVAAHVLEEAGDACRLGGIVGVSFLPRLLRRRQIRQAEQLARRVARGAEGLHHREAAVGRAAKPGRCVLAVAVEEDDRRAPDRAGAAAEAAPRREPR